MGIELKVKIAAIAILIALMWLISAAARADAYYGANPERPFCEQVSACEKPEAVKKQQPPKRKGPTLSNQIKALKALQARVVEVEGKIGLAGNIAETRKDVQQLRAEVEVLIHAVSDNLTYIHDTAERNVNLEDYVLREVGYLHRTVENLERLSKPVRFAPQVGFLILGALDGTVYTGAPIGIRLSLTFTRMLEFGADLSVLVSGGDRKFGSQARGFLGLTAITSRFSLEVGFSSTWVGYNNQAQAISMSLTGDVSMKAILVRGLYMSLIPMAGVELDKGNPAAVFGGRAMLGYEF